MKHYLAQLDRFNSYQRVYIDETSIDTYIHRPYGRALKGELVKSKINGRRYKRISIVAAQIDNRLIAPMIYQNTMNSVFFEAWFEQWLLTSLTTKSVIILDNARFHRIKILQGLAQKQGHTVLPLSPYSPELNPIEKTWGNIKKYLRKVLPKFDSFDEALMSYPCLN